VKAPHVLLVISAHGYGHLSQVAPVINAMCEQLPEIQLTVQGNFPKDIIAKRIKGEFALYSTAADVGFAMHGPSEIDWPTTQSWYQQFHARWDEQLQAETQLLLDLGIDLVIADVPYLPLVAATEAAIPSVAYSSLNWVDTLLENPQVATALGQEIEQMRVAYASADYFIQPEPSIPMAWLEGYGKIKRCPIDPVAATPARRSDALKQTLQLNPKTKLILVGLGGIPGNHTADQWPELAGIHWLIEGELPAKRKDLHQINDLNWPYPDLVGSVDLVVTKPGYGTFTEAARCGVPVLNIARDNWAETPFLIQWLKKIVAFKSVTLKQVLNGDISTEVMELLTQGHRPAMKKSGVQQAVELLLPLLKQTNHL
jgi:UDP:flavonoid glycosyltransferase YjiC (YdhE family)